MRFDAQSTITDGEAMPASDRILLRQRASRYARQHDDSTVRTKPAISFKQGDSSYAIYLSDLREIRQLRQRRSIPGASDVVPEVFHYRGELLSLHYLDAYFSGSRREEESPWVLIAENQSVRFGILAAELTSVEDIEAGELGQVPITFGERTANIHGIVGGGTLLLNVTALIASPSFFSAF